MTQLYPDLSDQFREKIQSFVLTLLKKDPADRPAMATIIQDAAVYPLFHEWINKIGTYGHLQIRKYFSGKEFALADAPPIAAGTPSGLRGSMKIKRHASNNDAKLKSISTIGRGRTV